MTDEGLSELTEQLRRHGNGAAEKAAEENINAAFEELYVGMTLARAALNTDYPDLTTERVELISRLAWAQSELQLGGGTRVPDDLERVDLLAESVSASGPKQPDWIEVSGSQHDCGECGASFLDLVFVYPNTDEEVTWLACPDCGWEERTPDMPVVENDWYNLRYGG